MSVGIETIQDSGSNTLANGLGVSHHVRGLMSYWIRTQTDHRISRTTVKRATNLEQQVIRINFRRSTGIPIKSSLAWWSRSLRARLPCKLLVWCNLLPCLSRPLDSVLVILTARRCHSVGNRNNRQPTCLVEQIIVRCCCHVGTISSLGCHGLQLCFGVSSCRFYVWKVAVSHTLL